LKPTIYPNQSTRDAVFSIYLVPTAITKERPAVSVCVPILEISLVLVSSNFSRA
jgi:hypothetical protein